MSLVDLIVSENYIYLLLSIMTSKALSIWIILGLFVCHDLSAQQIELQYIGRILEVGTNSVDAFMNKPCDIDGDSKGNYYVLETGGCQVKKFDKNLKYIKSFGRFGKGPGEFIRPSSIFIDDNDRIYVGDGMQSKILVFDVDGRYLEAISVSKTELIFKILKNGNMIFRNPIAGVRADKKLSLLHIVDSDGKVIQKIGEGKIFKKTRLAIGGNRFRFDVDKTGNIAVVFLFQNRIEKFDSSGELQFSIQREISPKMVTYKKENAYYALTKGVSFDKKGRLWNLERVKRPTRPNREDYEKARQNGLQRPDMSKLDLPEKTDQFALDIYDQEGLRLNRHNLVHYCDNLRIIGDKLFVCDTEVAMDFFVYQIIEKVSQ